MIAEHRSTEPKTTLSLSIGLSQRSGMVGMFGWLIAFAIARPALAFLKSAGQHS